MACGANHSMAVVGEGIIEVSPKHGGRANEKTANKWEIAVKLNEEFIPPRRGSLLEDEASIIKPNS